MKLLMIASFPGSILAFRGELIKSLIKHGVAVTVAAPGLSTAGTVRRDLEAIGAAAVDIRLHRTGMNPFKDLLSIWDLYRKMRALRPEIVIAYTIKPVIYGMLAAWLARVPRRFALITGLGNVFTRPDAGLLASIVSRLYRLALGKAGKVFFQNPDDQALLQQQGLLRSTTPSVVVNGSGINLDEYGLRAMPQPPVSFLMIARLLGDKGVREFAQAAQRVRSKYPDVRCSLAGWIDSNRDAISQQELDAWVERGDISYLGRLSDVRPAIAVCWAYVLPSYYGEGTPRTVLEAMAIGRAIITTDAPGCRETVNEGENGFLVPVRSVDALAGAMLRLVENEELTASMGQRSRKIAEAKYDVHKVNAVMLREMGLT
jgi:glycosyltransferase involved in cell wall biosynthesis